jgi:hypothetical protein
LRGLGEPAKLAAAWADHQQQVPGALDEASWEAARLLESRPELVVVERYSSGTVPCERCRPHGPFRPAPATTIVEILGYCQTVPYSGEHAKDAPDVADHLG